MSGTPTGQLWEHASPHAHVLSEQLGTLKQLARKVLDRNVPLSHTLEVGHLGHPISEPENYGTPLGHPGDTDELLSSMKRLESDEISIAILETGEIQIIVSERGTFQVSSSTVIFSPRDMYAYVTMTERERRMLHSFKRCFGGTTEWRTIG